MNKEKLIKIANQMVAPEKEYWQQTKVRQLAQNDLILLE